MALQIYTGDRVGDYIMQGAQSFGGGIGGGLANMADAFAKAQEKKKQLAAQGKAADALVKSSPDLLKSLGMTPEDWALQSPTDKHAAVQGAIGAQQFAEGQQRGEMRVLDMLEREQQLADREAATKNARRIPDWLSRTGELMQPHLNPDPGQVGTGEDVPLEVPGLNAFSAMGRGSKETGFVPPIDKVDDFLRAAGGRNPEGMGPDQFIEDPETGWRGFKSGHTVLPSGFNPAKQQTTIEVEDPNTGKLVTLPINPKTGAPILKPMAPPRVRRVTDEYGETKIIEELTPEEAKAAREAGKKPVAGTQENPHTPKTPAEAAKLKPGEWFKTPDGRLIQRK